MLQYWTLLILVQCKNDTTLVNSVQYRKIKDIFGLQIYFSLMKFQRGKMLWRSFIFYFVSFVLLISICLIKYCTECSFGSLNRRFVISGAFRVVA